MLRIGKLTDYALLIMSEMAKMPHVVMSAATLAERLHLTAPTVSKVLKILSESALVSSVRGADGGYRLAKSAAAISIAEIIAAMEGELAVTECCERTSLCVLDSKCTLRNNWQKINKVIQTLLSRLTLLDMLEPLASEQHLLTDVLSGLEHDK